MSDIATRLKCALGDTGVSQKKLSQMTGITEVTISRYVNGNRVPKATTLARIADSLGVGIGYFFDSVDKDSNVFTKDIISRQAAIDAVNKALDRETIIYGFVRKVAVDAIKTMPAAQPQRMRGNWVCIDGTNTECDQCGFVLEDWIQGAFYNFCPNCGADMREGESENNNQI